MKIIINEKNIDRIEAAIKEAEGRATCRTITAREVLRTAEEITRKLGISKKNLVGVKAEVDSNAQKLPNAYKWNAESTHFSIEAVASGWALTGIWRDDLWQRNNTVRIVLTETAEQAILAKYKGF